MIIEDIQETLEEINTIGSQFELTDSADLRFERTLTVENEDIFHIRLLKLSSVFFNKKTRNFEVDLTNVESAVKTMVKHDIMNFLENAIQAPIPKMTTLYMHYNRAEITDEIYYVWKYVLAHSERWLYRYYKTRTRHTENVINLLTYLMLRG